MRNGRWKMHICLMTIVLAAVLIGVCYYYTMEEKMPDETGGVLVKNELGVNHGC